MKRKVLVVPGVITMALVLSVSSALSVGGRVASAKQTHRQAAAPAAPKDPWAKQDKKFKGQTITYYGGSVGTDHLADVALQKAFTKSTGINVKINPMPSQSDATLAQLQRVFGAGPAPSMSPASTWSGPAPLHSTWSISRSRLPRTPNWRSAAS